MKTEIIFRETQLGVKNWVLLVVVLFAIIPASIFLLFQTMEAFGSTRIVLLSTFIFTILICSILLFIKLNITVTKDEIQYRLSTFHFSTQILSKNQIIEIENVVYNPIGEWGGWGIRMKGRDRAYNMYGNKGVQVTLKSGKIVLFGSQKPNELHKAIITNTNLSK